MRSIDVRMMRLEKTAGRMPRVVSIARVDWVSYSVRPCAESWWMVSEGAAVRAVATAATPSIAISAPVVSTCPMSLREARMPTTGMPID